VVSSRRHNECPFIGTELPEFSMFPCFPGHGRGIITWAQRDSDVPTLSRAKPWYHHVGTMNICSHGSSFQNSQCSHALQGLAVVSSRGHNETPTCQRSPGHCRGIITWARDKFLGTEHSRINDLTDLRGFPNVPTLSRAWPWYHHVGAMRLISFGPGQPRMAHSMLF